MTDFGTNTLGVSPDELDNAVRRGYVAAVRLLRNPDEAHDACQEAARKAWSARDSFDVRQPFYPWFYRILKNHCFDRLARKKRKHSAKQIFEREVAGESHSPDAESQVILKERASAIERAIEQLTDEQREMIELRHFQDASYAEIASALNLAPGTVMSRLYRARKRMRKILATDPDFSLERGML